MPDLSIRQLAEKLATSHTAVRKVIADIEAETGKKLGTFQGTGRATLLNESEQVQISQYFPKPDLKTRQNGQLSPLPTHSTDVLPPSSYGKQIELGGNYALHLHIHTTNALQYQAQAQRTDQNIQALLDQALAARYQQGQEDQREVDAVIAAAKSKLLEAGLAGLVVPPGKSDDAPSTPSSSSSESASESERSP